MDGNCWCVSNREGSFLWEYVTKIFHVIIKRWRILYITELPRPILWYKSDAPLFTPLISSHADFALSVNPVYPFSRFHSLSSSAFYSATLCLSLSQLLWCGFALHGTTAMAVVVGRVTTGDMQTERENREAERARGRWLTLVDLICFFSRRNRF